MCRYSMGNDMASSEFHEQEEIWTREQSELKERLIVRDEIDWNLQSIRLIGGVDVSFPKGDNDHACPGLVVLSYGGEDNLKVEYEDFSIEHLSVPYITNFLAFREVPLLKNKIDKLKQKNPELMPQVIMVDGNGVHHKRGFGIASHLGVLTGLPTIGVAKNLLHIDGISNDKDHKQQIKNKLKKKGDRFPLTGRSGETTLMALRTSQPHGSSPACKPIYVSVGHRVGLETAVDLVSECCKVRIPEPTRQADILSRVYLRKNYEEELAKCPCKNVQC